MRFSNNLGAILVGSWLILTGLVGLGVLDVPGIGVILASLAIAAGITLLVPMTGRGPKTMTALPRMGALLLAIWLLLTGLSALAALSFPQSNLIMGLLALAAGVLLILGR